MKKVTRSARHPVLPNDDAATSWVQPLTPNPPPQGSASVLEVAASPAGSQGLNALARA